MKMAAAGKLSHQNSLNFDSNDDADLSPSPNCRRSPVELSEASYYTDQLSETESSLEVFNDCPPSTPDAVVRDGAISPIRHQSRNDRYFEHQTSIVDGLLFEIYDQWQYHHRDSVDSDTFTECSSYSSYDHGASRMGSYQLELEQQHSPRLSKAYLQNKSIPELQKMHAEMKHTSAQLSAMLVRQLKRKDRRRAKMRRNCDVVTAILQAASQKRRIDSRIKFSIQPPMGDDAYQQWIDAMKSVCRLPLGIPKEFRKKFWLALADHHVKSLQLDWDKTLKVAFNDRSNPDDNKLGMQIVKDLHRTGCSGFSGEDNEQERALLKRVLLAYARWNKSVGYCQGFNVLAALILDVVEKNEGDALKVMVYLIDHVLPDSYFANNLTSLSVDMAVFRDLLRMKLPTLSRHLDYLQAAAREDTTGANYEPPLTNVFTMQWFLTLFATCLPKSTVLRVWDSVMLEGSEILLRCGLAIWAKLAKRIMRIQSADEFYSLMGTLTQDMLDSDLINTDDLIKKIYTMAPFPMPHLKDLREKYTYNITPFQAAMNASGRRHGGHHHIFSDDDDGDDEDLDAVNCFAFFPAQQGSAIKARESDQSDISGVSPGAYAATPENLAHAARAGFMAFSERMTTDLAALQKQYQKLRIRQKQAHIILQAASARHHAQRKEPMIPKIETPIAVNHLFIGRPTTSKNRQVAVGPRIASSAYQGPVPPAYQSSRRQLQIQKSEQHKLAKPRERLKGSSDEEMDSKSYAVVKEVPLTDQGNSATHNQLQDDVEQKDHCNTDRSDSSVSTTESNTSTHSVNSEKSAILSGDEQTVENRDVLKDSVMKDLDIKDNTTCGVHDENMPNQVDSDNVSSDQSSETLNGNGDHFKEEKQHVVQNGTSDAAVCGGGGGDVDNKIKEAKMQNPVKVDAGGDSSMIDNNTDDEDCSDLGAGWAPLRITCGEESPTHNVEDPIEEKSSPLKTEPFRITQNSSVKTPEQRTAEYVASLTIQRQIANETARRNSIKDEGQDGTLHVIPSCSPSPPTSPAKSPTSPNRVFNPFPNRHINQRRAQNGMKLGLYSPEILADLQNSPKKSSAFKGITRSHINACLQRQYVLGGKKDMKR